MEMFYKNGYRYMNVSLSTTINNNRVGLYHRYIDDELIDFSVFVNVNGEMNERFNTNDLNEALEIFDFISNNLNDM